MLQHLLTLTSASGGLASWMSVVIAATGLVYQNSRVVPSESNWPRAMVYITYLTMLAVAVSPETNVVIRGTATIMLTMGFVWMFFVGFKR